MRDLSRWDLNAQVTASDHNAVGVLQDLVEVLDAHGALDLGQDVDAAHAALSAEMANLVDGCAVADEGRGDRVDAQLAAKHDVSLVLLGDGGQADLDVRDVDTLLLAELATVDDVAVHVVAFDMVDLKANEPIVDQQDRTLLDLLGQELVVKGKALSRTCHAVVCRNDGLCPGLKCDLLVVQKLAGPDLGTLGIEHDGDGQCELGGDAAHALDIVAVVVMAAMAEVEAGDVHTALDETPQDLVTLGGGSHCANDLGPLVSHGRGLLSTL